MKSQTLPKSMVSNGKPTTTPVAVSRPGFVIESPYQTKVMSKVVASPLKSGTKLNGKPGQIITY